jgi:hypothetical protein
VEQEENDDDYYLDNLKLEDLTVEQETLIRNILLEENLINMDFDEDTM